MRNICKGCKYFEKDFERRLENNSDEEHPCFSCNTVSGLSFEPADEE